MNTPLLQIFTRSAIAALAGALCVGTNAIAAVSGINAPAGSFASIQFDDTTSLDSSSNPGTTNITLSTTPWGGTSWTLPLTTDGVTGDQAKGNLNSFFGGLTYGVTLNSINLTQLAVNTGFATLRLQFNIEFQMDAFGLPSQPTLYPNFIVNGTVQPAAGSFASVGGFINYYAVTTAGTIGVVETVNYGTTWNTAGPFSGTAAGIPNVGNTPALVGGTTLTLVGNIRFVVDPSSISVETESVPEPSTWAMLLVGAGAVAFRSFHRKN